MVIVLSAVRACSSGKGEDPGAERDDYKARANIWTAAGATTNARKEKPWRVNVITTLPLGSRAKLHLPATAGKWNNNKRRLISGGNSGSCRRV